jgi:hypothetical protein
MNSILNKKAKMDREIIFLVEESAEGGYSARALGYSIHTEAENLEKLRDAIKDAVKCHFEEKDLPHIIRLHMVKEEVISG